MTSLLLLLTLMGQTPAGPESAPSASKAASAVNAAWLVKARACGTARAAAAHPWPDRGALSSRVGAAERPLLKDNHLELRDAFGAFPHVQTSEHVALKWGDTLELDEADATQLLALIEQAWAHETVVLGFAPPTGSETWFFNVYLGDSGAPAPERLGVAGYFDHDDEEMPFLVIAADGIDDGLAPGGTLPSLIAHELLHALQAAPGRFPYTAENAWLAEATAEWAVGEVFPDDPWVGSLAFGMTLAPHLALTAYAPLSAGTVDGYHPYGAFLFFEHAGLRGVPATWVADVWRDPGQAGALEVVGARLATEGLVLIDVAASMALANATYAYPRGDQYRAFDDEAVEAFGDEAARGAFVVDDERRGQWTRVPLARAPQPLGYSVVEVSAGAELEERVVRFEGDLTGEDGGEAGWRVWLLAEGEATVELTLDNGAVRLVGEGAPARLVVAAVPPVSLPTERFSYRVLGGAPGEGDDREPETEPEPDVAGAAAGQSPPGLGCACFLPGGAVGMSAGWLALLGLLVSLGGMRRQQR